MLQKNNAITVVLPHLVVPTWVHTMLTDLSKNNPVNIYLHQNSAQGGLHERLAKLLITFEQKLSATLRNKYLQPVSLEGKFPLVQTLSNNTTINLTGKTVEGSVYLKAGNHTLSIYNLFGLLWQPKGNCFTVSSHLGQQTLCVYQTANNTDFITSRLNNVLAAINDVLYYTVSGNSTSNPALLIPGTSHWLACAAYLLAYPFMVLRIKLAARSGATKWHLALQNQQKETRIIPNPPGAFMADPFLFTHKQQNYLAFEFLPAGSNKGILSMMPVNGLETGSMTNILTEAHHLSYPCVFTHHEQCYVIPESKNDHQISCYRLDMDKQTCTDKKTLMTSIDAVDATLLFYNNLYWLFCTVKTGTLSNSGDALMIYYAPAPEGPWQAHQQNPVKLSNREARPAGHFIQENGKLIRPVQDGSYTYGGAIRMMEVQKLTPEIFEEKLHRMILPQEIHPKAKAIHTINQTGNLTVVDLVIHQKFAHV